MTQIFLLLVSHLAVITMMIWLWLSIPSSIRLSRRWRRRMSLSQTKHGSKAHLNAEYTDCWTQPFPAFCLRPRDICKLQFEHLQAWTSPVWLQFPPHWHDLPDRLCAASLEICVGHPWHVKRSVSYIPCLILCSSCFEGLSQEQWLHSSFADSWVCWGR